MGSDQHDEALLDEFEQQQRPSLNLDDDEDIIVVAHDDQQHWRGRYHDDDQINVVIDFIVRFDPATLSILYTDDGSNNSRITYQRGGQLVVWPFLWDPNVPGRREQRIDIPARPTSNPVK